MLSIIRENRLYFLLFLFFTILGSLLLMLTEQGDIIRYFSEHRSSFGDLFFSYFTKMGEEFLYATSVIAFLFYRYRYSFLVLVIGGLVTVFSYGLKDFFQHDRPSIFFQKLENLDQLNLISGVHLLSGQTSFPSGHTMSAFALFGFISFVLPKKKSLTILFFSIAFLVGLSRIYLVQHFVKDVYAGAILGTLIALLLYYFQSLIPVDTNRVLDRHLFFKGKDRA